MSKKLLIFLLVLIFALSGCGKKDKTDQSQNEIKNSDQAAMEHAKKQVADYFNYKAPTKETSYLSKSETNDIYYYATDGKRYVFPTEDVFLSWFPELDIEKIETQSLEKLYETPLGGNVEIRPGSLLKTPSLFDTFLVAKGTQIKKIDEALISELYGEKWQDLVIELPEYYFSQYNIIDPIKTKADYPEITEKNTIDLNKGLK